jgi:hypothetical protein
MRKVLLALAALIALSTLAYTHEWYPNECCGGRDCGVATVTQVASFPRDVLPIMTVTVNGVTVVVPNDFPRRASPDGRWHACIINVGPPTGPRLRCLFEPPNS